MSADKRSIAISTLDHSIVTYPLDKDGPILKSKKEFSTRDQTKWSPVVPVAMTSSGLTVGGTGKGEVPIICTGSDAGEMSRIRHGEQFATYMSLIINDVNQRSKITSFECLRSVVSLSVAITRAPYTRIRLMTTR